MGMPCEINSILKLPPEQYPQQLSKSAEHHAQKQGYRLIPIDVPIPLVDENWLAHADITINKLTWENGQTYISYEVNRLYSTPFAIKV
jgi:hypothetical protein